MPALLLFDVALVFGQGWGSAFP